MDLNLSLTQGAKYGGTEEDYMSGSRLTITEHLKKLPELLQFDQSMGPLKNSLYDLYWKLLTLQRQRNVNFAAKQT